MAEHHKWGLYYNCDEPYVQGHKCARLFYLEAAYYIIEEPDDDDDDKKAKESVASAPLDQHLAVISLGAIASICTRYYADLCHHWQ